MAARTAGAVKCAVPSDTTSNNQGAQSSSPMDPNPGIKNVYWNLIPILLTTCSLGSLITLADQQSHLVREFYFPNQSLWNNKKEIHAVIAQLKDKYRTQLGRLKSTGAGVAPSDPKAQTSCPWTLTREWLCDVLPDVPISEDKGDEEEEEEEDSERMDVEEDNEGYSARWQDTYQGLLTARLGQSTSQLSHELQSYDARTAFRPTPIIVVPSSVSSMTSSLSHTSQRKQQATPPSHSSQTSSTKGKSAIEQMKDNFPGTPSSRQLMMHE
ncbi:hypothetical protein BU15DRAFT_67349 [Melanogaster broomeanus]|nr:hypothetical protein BU15DRAFT_67349 [Melanogaster broomeanus]